MKETDMAEENFRKLAALFPKAVTEITNDRGEVIRAIDADALRAEISVAVVEGNQQRYEFTWPGKRKAVELADQPITKVLIPEPAKSCGREGTPGITDSGNIYIEGDNLDALKLMRKDFSNSIKVIFIDPPYNTGGNFGYNDDFSQRRKKYLMGSGQLDPSGKPLVPEPEMNGRFHADWLNMIYPRLKAAKELMSDDAVIFITLDDHENSNLRKIADEIFGEENFITEFIWVKKKKPSFLHKNVGKLFDYVLCYAKNSEAVKAFSVEKTTPGKKYPLNNAGNKRSTLVFPPGSVHFSMSDQIVEPQDMSAGNIYTKLLNRLVIKDGINENEMILEGEWRYSQARLNEIIADKEKLVISKIPFRPNHIKAGGEIKKMKNILSPSTYDCETNEDAATQLEELFGKGCSPFDTPKPVGLPELLIKAVTYDDKDAVILDFFSGSATTAHAVMQLNAEDCGNRRFIMIQHPEKTDEKSIAAKYGYKTICDIGEERIRRAGEKIRGKYPTVPDTGFCVFRVENA